MVKLTLDLIARGTSGYTKKKRDEPIQQYLRRLTHLYLEARNLDDVGDELGLCRSLTVLYLYDNQLFSIPVLNQNQNLTHLYLQNNSISRIQNLSALHRLSKLYLGHNCITVLEGLDHLEQLQELHIEQQNLPSCEKLLFDPRTLKALTKSLQVLNVSGNNLDSLRELRCLSNLQQLMASENFLSEMRDLTHTLPHMHHLWRLDLNSNPITHKPKYRDRIIIMSKSLEILDGKEISETLKEFLLKWHASKVSSATASKRHSKDWGPMATLDDICLTTSSYASGDLPPLQGVHKRLSVPGYVIPGLPRKQFDEVLARSTSVPNSSHAQRRIWDPKKQRLQSPPRFSDEFALPMSNGTRAHRLSQLVAVNIDLVDAPPLSRHASHI